MLERYVIALLLALRIRVRLLCPTEVGRLRILGRERFTGRIGNAKGVVRPLEISGRYMLPALTSALSTRPEVALKALPRVLRARLAELVLELVALATRGNLLAQLLVDE